MGGKDKRKLKKLQKRHAHKKVKSKQDNSDRPAPIPEKESEETVEIEYVTAGIDESNPLFDNFKSVFGVLQDKPASKADRAGDTPKEDTEKAEEEQKEEEEEGEKPLSRKQRKKQRRLDVAQLKQLVARPDVVEVHDSNAADPKLLVHLKAYRNTVPIPKHWSQKRKYLQGKRGIEKPPFALPAFIADTGISRIREAFLAREEAKRARARQREKMQPKLHKIDIDYQVLHDAFFKYQTKPKMSRHGDLYYEGKEFEVKLPEQKHGQLSDRLKKALGMPDGAPPPWLINMQRYGPPPAYPHARIPGLNAPIPPGASFGYHPGGWGKPPVDEMGNPLYGDVFGTDAGDDDYVDPIDKKLWGEMEEESSDEDESDEDEDRPDDFGGTETGGITSTQPPPSEGLTGTESSTMMETSTGMETPDMLQIRKGMRDDGPKQLFHVLDQQKTSTTTRQLVGSEYTYQMPGQGKPQENVEVSLNPGEVEDYQNPELAQEKFDRVREEEAERMRLEKGDYNEFMEGEKRKRKRPESKDKTSKPYKQFKF